MCFKDKAGTCGTMDEYREDKRWMYGLWAELRNEAVERRIECVLKEVFL